MIARTMPFIKDSPSYGRTILSRRNETVDIAKRLGFIKPDDLRLLNASSRKVVAVFNGAIHMTRNTMRFYVRVVIGYYKYVSAIASIELDASDVLSSFGELSRVVNANLEVLPDSWIDFWGAEDPRFSIVDEHETLIYTGRTLAYFTAREYTPGRTFPVVAIKINGVWKKTSYIALPHGFEALIQSDKDAFIVESGYGDYLVFHRPHEVSGKYYVLISRTRKLPKDSELTPLVLEESWRVMDSAPFEEKIGWGPTAIPLSKGEYLALLHGVEAKTQIYRVFAVIVKRDGNGSYRVSAVTPFYVMEPKTPEEIYGDRPMVVFPCGNTVIDDKLVVTYGAADTALGVAEIDLSELLHILDNNPIE
ncbi:MAG: glycosidase [Desulfurococcales archaeon]|nr:glycosidase [Desulfurococcales archaeon]